MLLRSFRTILVCICLLSLVGVSGVLTARATTPKTHTSRSIQPSYHGVAVPQRINTATLSKQKINTSSITQSKLGSYSSEEQSTSSSSKRASIPSPSDVVRVPPPTSTDPNANTGVSFNASKPDADGSGGTYNYLETVNGGVGIYTRSGNLELTSTYQAWFSKGTAQFVNPVSLWDDTGNRFLFSIIQLNSDNVLLSVAQQPNATGSYCNYSFSDLPNHDFDKLGVDADGIYITANIEEPDSNNVVNNELFYASRAALENCQTVSYSVWTGLTNSDGSIAEAITPAREDGSTPGVEYLINSIPTGGCQLTLWKLTASGNLSSTSVPTQCYSPAPPAKQKDSTTLLAVGDSSITQASLINGLLTVDNLGSYDWGDGNGPVGIVEWYQINPATARVAKQGAFGTPGYWLFYPSTVTTPNGHMLFVYNASSSSIYPGAWYVNQNLTNTTALANSTSYFGTGTFVPWGDYQSAWTDTDKKDPNAVWITGEYIVSPSSWGTSFDLVTP